MQKNSTLFQIITSVGTKVVVLLGSFITSIILARFLGPEGKGIVTAIFVIPNLLISIADLGIRQATAYHVGKKIFSPSNVFSSILIVWLVTSIASIVVAILYYLTGPSQQYGWYLLLIPLLTIPLMLMNKYIEGLFLGLQQIIMINLKHLLSFVVTLISVVILVVLLDLGVYGAALITLFAALITLIFSLIIIRKMIKIKLNYNKNIAKALIRKGIVYAVALFVLNLNYKIDIVFLERLTTSTDVGIYSIGVSLSELIWQIPTAMGMVLFSKSANSALEIDAVNRSTRLLRISWVPVIMLSTLFWILSPYIVPFLYGTDFNDSVSVIRLLLPGVVAMILFKILNADLAGRGYPLFALRVYIIAMIINIIFNFILIPLYGANGAALASSISYTVGAILFSIAYFRQAQIRFSELFVLNKNDIQLIKSLLLEILNKLKKGKNKCEY